MAQFHNVCFGKHIHFNRDEMGQIIQEPGSDREFSWYLPRKLRNKAQVGKVAYARTQFGLKPIVITQMTHWEETQGLTPELLPVVKILSDRRERKSKSEDKEYAKH